MFFTFPTIFFIIVLVSIGCAVGGRTLGVIGPKIWCPLVQHVTYIFYHDVLACYLIHTIMSNTLQFGRGWKQTIRVSRLVLFWVFFELYFGLKHLYSIRKVTEHSSPTMIAILFMNRRWLLLVARLYATNIPSFIQCHTESLLPCHNMHTVLIRRKWVSCVTNWARLGGSEQPACAWGACARLFSGVSPCCLGRPSRA